MAPPHVKWFFIVIVGICASLPTQSLVYAEGEDATSTNTTRVDNQCSPIHSRHDLLDNRLNGLHTQLNTLDTRLSTQHSSLDTHLTKQLTSLDTRLSTEHNSLDTRLSAQLNGLTTRQNGVDARLNRIDRRFDDLETAMSDMKEYLQQRLDAMEVKAELALAGTKQTREVTTADNQPTQPTQPTAAPRLPKDCQEAYTMGLTSSGVYRIAPEPNTTINVYCEQEVDGGGWVVFQVRKDGSVDFYRTWNSYKQGFGELTGEFWLGNTNIHILTQHLDQQLRIELTDPQGAEAFASYSHFSIANEMSKYRLDVSGYSAASTAGNCLNRFNEMKFSTKDQDKDIYSSSCAALREGAWWYINCGYSLNGQYRPTAWRTGVVWLTWKYVSLKGSRMMIRKNR